MLMNSQMHFNDFGHAMATIFTLAHSQLLKCLNHGDIMVKYVVSGRKHGDRNSFVNKDTRFIFLP